MKEAIKRICKLQPSYSAANTADMKERGRILRDELKPEIEAMAPMLASRLGRFGDTFHVDASDGTGLKTELPWVRFCSETMSPNPREGFYSVVHFSTDGSAVHVTVGCGSSVYKNGSFKELPNRELDEKTAWARSVVVDVFRTIAPFADTRDFGASRRLPLSFQRATAISKQVLYDDIDTEDFEDLFAQAAVRLKAIYEAQAVGRDVSHADQAQAFIEEIARPNSRRRRQGYGLPAAARKAVEMRAMDLAEEWLIGEGYTVTNTAAKESFDFLAERDGEEIKVEVKGTTSDEADAILMTRNEVDLHRAEKGSTALIIVTRIVLSQTDGKYSAAGGEREVLLEWDIDDWFLEATAFRCSRGVS